MLAAHSKPGRAQEEDAAREQQRQFDRHHGVGDGERLGRRAASSGASENSIENRWCSTPTGTIASPTMTASAAPGLRRAAAISERQLAREDDRGRHADEAEEAQHERQRRARRDARHSPVMLAIFVVCVRSRISPAVKKSALFASVCPIMCITAPAAPTGPMPRPNAISPMCSTLWYASIRL